MEINPFGATFNHRRHKIHFWKRKKDFEQVDATGNDRLIFLTSLVMLQDDKLERLFTCKFLSLI